MTSGNSALSLVPKRFYQFAPWDHKNSKGEPTTRDGEVIPTYGGKSVLDWNGEPVYAELAILRMLQEEGWGGVWVDGFRKRFYTGLFEPPLIVLPNPARNIFEKIASAKGSSGGCWDVLSWKGKRVLFAEAKRRKKDHIRPSQIKWLKAALRIGIPLRSFLLVEWDLRLQISSRRRFVSTGRLGSSQ